MSAPRIFTVGKDGAVTPVGGKLSLGRAQTKQWPRKGTRELLKSYGDSPWIRALLGKIGDSLIATEWQVLGPTRTASAKDVSLLKSIQRASPSAPGRKRVIKAMRDAGVLDVIEQHPMPGFIEAGNKLHSGKTMMKCLCVTTDLVGEGFMLVERASNGIGDPLSWWVLPPQWVENIPLPGGPAEFRVRTSGYGADLLKVPADQMVWMLEMDPLFPYGRGVGVGQSLSEDIDAHEFSAHHIVSALQNGAVADLVVMVDGLSEEQTERLEDRWMDKLRGFWRRKLPIFLNRKVDMQKITQTFEELQFAELRELERDIFMQSIGVPPEILGVVENSNRATINASGHIYQRYVLVPRCDRSATAYQRSLLPMWGDSENFIVSYVSPVEEDEDFKLASMTVAGQHSAHTVDEWRALSGHKELDGDKGKVFVHGLGLVASETPAGSTEDEDVDEPEDDDKSIELTRAPKITLTPAEAKRLAKTLGRKVSDKEFARAVGPTIARAVADFGQDMLSNVAPGLKFDVHSKRVVSFLKSTAVKKAKQVGKTSRTKIANILANGVRDGKTLNEVVPQIMGVFKGKGGAYRAQRIGVTESTRANGFGAVEGMRQGGVEEKEWLAVDDGATRDTHEELDGKREALDDDFVSSSGASGPHPGELGEPEEDINCRCNLLAVVNGETGIGKHASVRKLVWKMKDARRTKHQRSIKNAAERALSKQGSAVKAELDRNL